MRNQVFTSLLFLLALSLLSCNGTKKAKTGDGSKGKKSTSSSLVNFDSSPTLSDVLERAEKENECLIFIDFEAGSSKGENTPYPEIMVNQKWA